MICRCGGKPRLLRLSRSSIYYLPRLNSASGLTIAISMDGTGAGRDNFFVEWLWRSVILRFPPCFETSVKVRPS
jgi:hypothetical protein